MNSPKELILEAYSILDNLTPLKYDCGKLCGSYCCQNNGEDGETLGMWLLPFEKEILKDFTKFSFNKTKDGTQTVTCNGRCNRSYRPFACRIYPFYASIQKTIDGREKISIKPDPRARFSCPIVSFSSYLRPSIEFNSGVKRAVRVLMKNEHLKKDLYEISDFLFEIENMQKKLIK